MANPLDNDKIEALLRKPEPRKRNPRTKSTDYTKVETRTYTTWFVLHHKFGACQNPDCGDPRPLRAQEGNAMVIEIEGTSMCRYCFLNGFMVVDG